MEFDGKLCDGLRTPSDIVEALRPKCIDERLVQLALEKLAKTRLLEPSFKVPNPCENKSSLFRNAERSIAENGADGSRSADGDLVARLHPVAAPYKRHTV